MLTSSHALRVVGVALLLVASACDVRLPTTDPTGSAHVVALTPSFAPPPQPLSTAAPERVPPEANDAALRTACATRVLEELIRAFNVGDAAAVGRVLGPGPLASQAFRWVSIYDALRGDAEYSDNGARQMLLERYSLGQRLKLVSVSASNGPSWHGGIDAGLRVEASLPGASAPKLLHGKTALSCVAGRIYVLSLGED